LDSNSKPRAGRAPAARPRNFTDIAFTAAVKRAQARYGARERNLELEKEVDRRTEVTPALAAWLAERTSFFLGTASADGRPYVQHRGGPAGFLVALGPQHLGWAEFSGNKQYITLGNLSENDRAIIFAIDYAGRRRVKIWGRAEVLEDAALVERLTPTGLAQAPTRALRFAVEAWDVNCPSHIPRLFTTEEVEAGAAQMLARIEALEAELEALRRRPAKRR
jgi:uncharacterized protein